MNPNHTPNDAKAASLAALEAIQANTQAMLDLLTSISENLERFFAHSLQYSNALTLLTQPNSNSAPAAAAGSYTEFTAESLIMTYNDKGEPAYKLIGHPYSKFGVRVWPEVLPQLGIDASELKPGPNPIAPRRVVALMGDTGPRKVTGPAGAPQPASAVEEAPALSKALSSTRGAVEAPPF